MSYADSLLKHSVTLLTDANQDESLLEVSLRRSISASYYGLFYRLSEDAVEILAPNVTDETRHRIQRWFDHAEMKRVCTRFAALESPLKQLIGEQTSGDLRTVSLNFKQLQEARHSADYDMSFHVTQDIARDFFVMAVIADDAWKRLRGTPEANIFILSLLMWKNWDRERM